MSKEIERRTTHGKSEVLRRMDGRVLLQKKEAYRIARVMGMAFCPVNVKDSFVGYLIPPSVEGVPAEPLRIEVRVRSFPSTDHESTLIERKVEQKLSVRTLYCEAFSDGMAVCYDLDSVSPLLSWHDREVTAVTVAKNGKRTAKRVGYIPYSLGRMIRLGEDVNRDPLTPSNDVTKDGPVSGPLF